MDEQVQIGLIGAGAIFRDRHLPALVRLPGVRLQAVANRSRASGQRVAEQFDVKEVMEDWQALLQRDDIDAVMIGTWPYMHCAMTVAALRAGKHVFCQARMAMDMAEAKTMLAEAQRHPQLVSVLCPCPHRMPFEPYVRKVLHEKQLGDLTLVELLSRSAANNDMHSVHWRERRELSGRQALAMGIYAELLHAWVGPYAQLRAETAVPLAQKTDAAGQSVRIEVPQIITITGRLTQGPLVTETHTGLVQDATTPIEQITLWGTRGTLRHQFLTDTLERAASGESLKPVDVPVTLRRPWRVEADFVQAVRAAMRSDAIDYGMNPTLDQGLLYMRKVEAVHRSAAEGQTIDPQAL